LIVADQSIKYANQSLKLPQTKQPAENTATSKARSKNPRRNAYFSSANIRRAVNLLSKIPPKTHLSDYFSEKLGLLVQQENNSGISFEHIIKFIKHFKHFQKKRLTVKQMKTNMEAINEDFPIVAQSTFYRYIIKTCNLRYRNEKYVHAVFKEDKKKECRQITTKLIARILNTNNTLYFYDESTVVIKAANSKNWTFSDERPIKTVSCTRISVSLNLICSTKNIVSFCISSANLSSHQVFSFVHDSVAHIYRTEQSTFPVFLVLDNGPKNRNKKIEDICKKKNAAFVYTTPTTPQHNFAENVFLLIKKKISKAAPSTRYV